MKALAAIALALLITDTQAKRLQHERIYADAWCQANGGRGEVSNTDGTRTDCLTLGYAIEADFSDKYSEAIGQAAHYARLTARLPGVLLIVESAQGCRYLERARLTIAAVRVQTVYGLMPVRLWVIGEEYCE